MRRTAVALAIIGVLGALPAAASAHKYTAYAGEAAQPPKSAPPGTALNVFQPAKLKVRAGDKVTYNNFAFHTVSVLGKGVPFPPIALPDGTEKYSGINDPQGNPFFFNGLQKFKYNEAVFGPVGDTIVDDKATHSSGAFGGDENGNPGKYTLEFAKPGIYKVLCLIHPGMKQTVKVLKKKAEGADSDAKVKREILRQTRRHYKDAAAAAKTTVPANTVYAGAERKHATLLAFLPSTLTVAKGTTVSFALMAPSEVHNMVWGPQAYVEQFAQQTDLFPQGPGTPNQVSPPFVYSSEPASGAGWTYSGNEYGNGFFWSPLMDDQPGNPPNGLPGVEQITFDTPGTYSYFCAIHGPQMKGTIIVQ